MKLKDNPLEKTILTKSQAELLCGKRKSVRSQIGFQSVIGDFEN